MNEAQRVAADDPDNARALLLAQASLVKRPIVQWPNGALSVGFEPARFAESAGRR